MVMTEFATKADFSRAPLGHPFLECCPTCSLETGTILIKKKGPLVMHSRFSSRNKEIPKYIINPEVQCEFCQFLAMYFASENIDPKTDGRHAAFKFVKRLEDGSEKTEAYCPFSEHDHPDLILADGSKVKARHGMVVLIEEKENGIAMKQILKPGI